MSRPPRIWRWLTASLGRRSRERELAEEFRHHIEELEAEHRRQGLTAEEARRAARRAFGPASTFAEEVRDAWPGRRAFDLARDARFGLRVLSRYRALTVAVILTLGLCLGGNTAMMAVLNQLVLQPPPFEAPDRLVDVYSVYAGLGAEDAGSNAYRLGRMAALGDLHRGAVLWSDEWKTVRWKGASRRLKGWWASDRVLETLDLAPLRGRGFDPDESGAVVLAERFWEEAMGGRPEAVGAGMVIDEVPHRIVGVVAGLPGDVAYVRVRRWTVEELAGSQYDARHDRQGRLWLRLADGATLAELRTRLADLDQRELADGSAADRERAGREGFASRADPIADVLSRDRRPRLYVLQAAALLALLIGAFNVAGLLTARAHARRGEIDTRVALGATRARLVQQWVTESALLTALGWGAGLLVAWVLLRHAALWVGQPSDTGAASYLTPGVVAASLVLAATTAALLGALSAAQVAGMTRRSGGLSSGERSTPGVGLRRLGARLASTQTAVAVVLVGVAGLLLLSYARVVAQDLGYDPEALLMMRIALPEDRYRDAESRDLFAERLEHALSGIPGVTAVARTSFVPTFGHPDVALHVSGSDEAVRDGAARVAFTQVSPGYFAAMGIPILAGRGIEDGDTAWWREAVVVDRRLARRAFGEGPAIGRRIRLGPTPRQPEAWPVVVGVAAEVHHSGWDETGGLPLVYRPIRESGRGEFSVIVRSRREPSELVPALRATVRTLDPDVPVFRLGPVNAFLAESVQPRLALLSVIGGFAVMAVILTMLGIGGVLSFEVVSRTRELGLRLALGAEPGSVMWLVLRQALVRVVWGLLPGLVVLHVAARVVSGLLYQSSEADGLVYAAVALGALGVGLVAGYVPARRAVRLAPTEALRVG